MFVVFNWRMKVRRGALNPWENKKNLHEKTAECEKNQCPEFDVEFLVYGLMTLFYRPFFR